MSFKLHHNPAGQGALLCLHGAGVAGGLTFDAMLNEFDHLEWILVPDLYGAGSTTHTKGEMDFTIQQLITHLGELIAHLDLTIDYLAGYSFGGLVAIELAEQLTGLNRVALIEPALMEASSWQSTLLRRQRYVDATAHLRTQTDIDRGISDFLDVVSPKRSKHPRVESRVIKRLGHRPIGLACALDAVYQHAQDWNRDHAIARLPATLSLIGSRTPPEAHALHQSLASDRADWCYQSIDGVDHALPYQKPTVVANHLARWFTRADA